MTYYKMRMVLMKIKKETNKNKNRKKQKHRKQIKTILMCFVILVLNIAFFIQLTWPRVKVTFLVLSLLSVPEQVLITP